MEESKRAASQEAEAQTNKNLIAWKHSNASHSSRSKENLVKIKNPNLNVRALMAECRKRKIKRVIPQTDV